MLFFLFIFFYLGSIFWSFSTVLIERWHNWKWGILTWRSECPKCNHILTIMDLFPIFSYIWNRGRCSHCNVSISKFYPVAEIVMGSIFMILGYAALLLWYDIIGMRMLLLLTFGFITGVYILYDIRYMEIPDQIMIPAIYLLISIPFFSLLFSGYSEYTFHTFHISTYDRGIWAWVLYSFFYMQILIPGWYFFIKNKKWKYLFELIWSYFTFPIAILIDFFRRKKEDENIEIPTWIWGGDLRIAIFIGLTLGTLHGVVSFAIAYITGSIVWITIIIYNSVLWKKTESQIPFWPFLWFWWLISILFYIPIEIFFNIISN